MIRPEGAAQLALLGPPNAGKSSLHARLTASGAHVAPYPFTTQYPEPGMMPHDDIRFQLVDLPAVSPAHPIPWLAGTLQTADGALLVVDLADPGCVEQVEDVHAVLRERRVTLTDRWDAAGAPADRAAEGDDDPFALRLPTLLLANKADRLANPEAELRAFLEVAGLRHPAFAVSATTGRDLGKIGSWLFGHLGIARVHKDLARSLKYARVWGKSGFEGQHVGREHPLADGDVVELHV
jgi:ribosome-interacting GTPase 1